MGASGESASRETHAGRARGGWAATGAIAILCAAVYGTIAVRSYAPGTFLLGDCPYYATAAVSLLADGDLDVENNLAGGARRHAGFVSIGPDGTWRPKHPVLMPVVSIPFLAAFGVRGFLIFNLAVLAAVAAATHRLAMRGAAPLPAAVAAGVTCLVSFVPAYAYNYSPDAFAALPAILALIFLVDGRDLAAGAAAGVALVAKPAHMILIVACVAAGALSRGRGAVLRFGAGAAPAVVALVLYNALLFGGPLTTGYSRMLAPERAAGFVSQQEDFSLAAMPANLAAQVLDRKHGLLFTAPSVLVALLGLAALGRRRRAAALLVGGLIGAYWIFFASFLDWNASHFGNRYLFVPLLASALPLAALLGRVMPGRRGAPAPRGAA